MLGYEPRRRAVALAEGPEALPCPGPDYCDGGQAAGVELLSADHGGDLRYRYALDHKQLEVHQQSHVSTRRRGSRGAVGTACAHERGVFVLAQLRRGLRGQPPRDRIVLPVGGLVEHCHGHRALERAALADRGAGPAHHAAYLRRRRRCGQALVHRGAHGAAALDAAELRLLACDIQLAAVAVTVRDALHAHAVRAHGLGDEVELRRDAPLTAGERRGLHVLGCEHAVYAAIRAGEVRGGVYHLGELRLKAPGGQLPRLCRLIEHGHAHSAAENYLGADSADAAGVDVHPVPDQLAHGGHPGREAVLVRYDEGALLHADNGADRAAVRKHLDILRPLALQAVAEAHLRLGVALHLGRDNSAHQQLARVEHPRLYAGEGEHRDGYALLRHAGCVKLELHGHRGAHAAGRSAAIGRVDHRGRNAGRDADAAIVDLLAPDYDGPLGAEYALHVRHGVGHNGLGRLLDRHGVFKYLFTAGYAAALH